MDSAEVGDKDQTSDTYIVCEQDWCCHIGALSAVTEGYMCVVETLEDTSWVLLRGISGYLYECYRNYSQIFYIAMI